MWAIGTSQSGFALVGIILKKLTNIRGNYQLFYTAFYFPLKTSQQKYHFLWVVVVIVGSWSWYCFNLFWKKNTEKFLFSHQSFGRTRLLELQTYLEEPCPLLANVQYDQSESIARICKQTKLREVWVLSSISNLHWCNLHKLPCNLR